MWSPSNSIDILDVSGGVDALAQRSQVLLDSFWSSPLPQSAPAHEAPGAGPGPILLPTLTLTPLTDEASSGEGRSDDSSMDGWTCVARVPLRSSALDPPLGLEDLEDLEATASRVLALCMGSAPHCTALPVHPAYLDAVVQAHAAQRRALKNTLRAEIDTVKASARVAAGSSMAFDTAKETARTDAVLSGWRDELVGSGTPPDQISAMLSMYAAMAEWSTARMDEVVAEEVVLARLRSLERTHRRAAEWLLEMQVAEARAYATMVDLRCALSDRADAARTSVQDALDTLNVEQEGAIADLRTRHEDQLSSLTDDMDSDRGVVLEAQAADILELRDSHAAARTATIHRAIASFAASVMSSFSPQHSPSRTSPAPSHNNHLPREYTVDPSSLLPPKSRYTTP